MNYLISWMSFGLIVYIILWIKQLKKPATKNSYKEIYQNNGLIPFVRGFLSIFLGPLVLVLLYYIYKKEKQ